MFLSQKSLKRLFIPVLILAGSTGISKAQEVDSVQVDTVAKVKETRGPKITGIVKDASTGKGISGISISIPGYSATFTDEKGGFKISIPNQHADIYISGQGYHTKIVALKGKKTVEVVLHEDAYSSLYDVAKVPFTSASMSRTPFAVTTINTQGNWDRLSETADSYLQAKVAGLNATRRSGTPGIGADLQLRGYSSLFGSNQPLIVVDGMIYDTNSYGTSLISGHKTNHLANIELKDIDNITVLKDGSSTYGTRGANGVILITTGRAKGEATRLDFGAYGGYSSKATELPVMQADMYRVYLADVLKTKGETDAEIAQRPFMVPGTNPGNHKNTNWQDQVQNAGYSQNYYLKVAGGDNIATYALSLGYLSNQGLTKNTDLTKYQTRFNANLNLSSKLKGEANLAFTRAEQNLKPQGRAFTTNPLYLSLTKAPFLAPFEYSNQDIVSPNIAGVDYFGVSNPFSAVETLTARDRNYRFTGSAGFTYTFSPAIALHALAGINFDKVRENYFFPRLGITPVTLNTAIGYNQSGANVQRLFAFNTDSWLSWNKSVVGEYSVAANVGFRFNSNNSENDYGIGFNSASDEFVTLGSGEGTLRTVGGTIGQWNWLNTYFNVDYSKYNKYFFSFNVAVDGSSRFGDNIAYSLKSGDNSMAIMPSVSAAWLLSSEPFMADVKAVETLKLRASLGITGNEDIGNYGSNTYYVSQNFLNRQGIVRGNIGNRSLQWETVSKANIGLDAAFFKERLNLTLDVYRNHTSDMIIYKPTNSAAGFDFVATNDGGMRNTGFELSASGRLINTSKLKWDLGVNIGRYKNEVTKLPSQLTTSYAGAEYMVRTGMAANLFYGYKSAGVYSSNAEASNVYNRLSDGSIVKAQGGDVRFVNFNFSNDALADGTGVTLIDEQDRTVIGDPNPDFYGGISNALSYKRWTLNTLFSFSYGNDIYNATRQRLEAMSGYENQTLSVINRWRTDGQVTNVPRAMWGDPMENSRFSDRWIEDGSYLRLRTVSLAYDVPIRTVIKSATVYLTANNLFTLTRYLGYDPEFSSSGSIFARGVDTGLEPQIKSVQLGVRIGL